MWVRHLFGGHRGEIAEMPYAAAVRAVASGTVEMVRVDDGPVTEVALPPLIAEAPLSPPSMHGIPRTRRRLSSAGKLRG